MSKPVWPLVLLCLSLTGCASMVSGAAAGFGENLSGAILNQDDPDIVRAGMPSYIILLDSLLQGDPDSPALLASAANLYASYAAVFADDEQRAMRLSRHGRDYALRALCADYRPACDWPGLDYDAFVATLGGLRASQADTLYVYGFATLAYLRAHSSDWNALAELPQAQALLERYLVISGHEARSSAHTYLGILMTLRPPSLGGEPEAARRHFEKAIALTGGRDLGAKVEFARSYAKLLYERELHDRLVGEVLAADPHADDMTLLNVLAQAEALRLQAEADDYF